MNKTTNVIIAVVAVAVIAVGAVLLFGNKGDESPKGTDTTTGTNSPSTPDNSGNSELADDEIAATITYTNDGFNPSRVTVPAGSAIRIVNESSKTAAPSSDNHPTHTLNPELNFPDIGPGQSATMVVSETGTWGIHDHYDADKRATVVVE